MHPVREKLELLLHLAVRRYQLDQAKTFSTTRCATSRCSSLHAADPSMSGEKRGAAAFTPPPPPLHDPVTMCSKHHGWPSFRLKEVVSKRARSARGAVLEKCPELAINLDGRTIRSTLSESLRAAHRMHFPPPALDAARPPRSVAARDLGAVDSRTELQGKTLRCEKATPLGAR